MNVSRFPRLARLRARLSAALFERPITQAYLLSAVFMLLAGLAVAYADTRPAAAVGKHLVMLTAMLGASRLFAEKRLRGLWFVIVGALTLGVALDVAGTLR